MSNVFKKNLQIVDRVESGPTLQAGRNLFSEIFVQTMTDHAVLEAADINALKTLPFITLPLSTHALICGSKSTSVHCTILLSGIAFQYKQTPLGARQILSVRIPGDIIDLQRLFSGSCDCNTSTLTAAEVGLVRRDDLFKLFQTRPRIAEALSKSALLESAILREWIINLGRRDAKTRVAHLLCEFASRMEARNLTGDYGCYIPMTQEQLGDALGLTSVHVNRMLRALENDGLISRNGRQRVFPQIEELQQIGEFDKSYLHL